MGSSHVVIVALASVHVESLISKSLAFEGKSEHMDSMRLLAHKAFYIHQA